MKYVEAFSKYGAKLRNPQWSVCAENAKGELVVSLWQHHFGKSVSGCIRCSANASRWEGPGNTEFRASLDKAFATNQVIRVVIARTDNSSAVEKGDDASKLNNTFSAREDWMGRIVAWDGETYEFEFKQQA